MNRYPHAGKLPPVTRENPATGRGHPHRAGTWSWITFLVTGPEEKLMAWQEAAMFTVEFFDRRGQTVRARAHGEGRGQVAYDAAVLLAKQHDVTVQDLCEHGNPDAESDPYPIVHLGSHGMQWPPVAGGSLK